VKTGEMWKVVVFDTTRQIDKSFLIKAIGYERERLLEILIEVYPQYNNIRIGKANV
jgi:hypothetical protein